MNVREALSRVPSPFWAHQTPRFWQDVHIAEALYLFGEFPVSANGTVRWRDAAGAPRVAERHPHFERTTAETPIPPTQFWRVVRENRFRRPAQRGLVDRYDDSGRPLLIALGFRLLGGISPFLFFWLGPLLAVPVLFWAGGELWRAGHARTGVVLMLLIGSWPFLAEALALSYSTAGFQVLALLIAVPLASYAALSPRPRPAGLLLRSAVAGTLLAACVLARGGALLTVAAPALAVGLGAWRVAGGGGRPRALRAAGILGAGLLLLGLPYLGARMAVGRLIARTAAQYGRTEVAPQQHALWFGLWTGLGDFDREKGYRWLDEAASEAAVAAGGTRLRSAGYDAVNEAVYRRLILADVEADPLWYGGILLRRLFAVVTQRKLWPWPPLSGRSTAPARHRNEGVIDAYYALVAPADQLGIGRWRLEIPVPLLALPAATVLVWAARRRDPCWPGRGLVLFAVAVGALPLPVFVTTAGAIEPQAFVLVYLLALAFLAEALPPQRHPGGAQTR
ncbi:MAG TPA: hypothetical protein VMR21_15825 [Vicinamibacteria bacterium]|nr:hypothetical protein [Vicinamibacteria bacterium]